MSILDSNKTEQIGWCYVWSLCMLWLCLTISDMRFGGYSDTGQYETVHHHHKKHNRTFVLHVCYNNNASLERQLLDQYLPQSSIHSMQGGSLKNFEECINQQYTANYTEYNMWFLIIPETVKEACPRAITSMTTALKHLHHTEIKYASFCNDCLAFPSAKRVRELRRYLLQYDTSFKDALTHDWTLSKTYIYTHPVNLFTDGIKECYVSR